LPKFLFQDQLKIAAHENVVKPYNTFKNAINEFLKPINDIKIELQEDLEEVEKLVDRISKKKIILSF
jgi:hypothetical protein